MAAAIMVGESLVGEGNEVAHVDLLIGSKSGPVGEAFANALANQKEGHTSLLAVVAPVILGLLAAMVFNRKFPLRGLFRTVFILPMMATPVAIALVWTMMFHPQLGVLNYLLTSVGLPPSQWVYHTDTVIPTLVMVETWHWTPLVMLIVLGGLAALPSDPFEAARIDGASNLGVLTRIILPLSWPGIVVSGIFAFLLGWNDVLFASVMTRPDSQTAAVALQIFGASQEGGAIPVYGQMMAASLVCAAPVVILYLIFQRYLVGGLTAGGVK